MSERSPILLLDGVTREPVAATLVDGVSAEEVRAADAAWIPFSFAAMREALGRGVSPDDLPENWHWEWERKLEAATEAGRFFGIECGAEMQALMAIRRDKTCRLPEQVGQPLVYVDYVATAPWNQPGLVTQPRYRGCGRFLVTAAIEASLKLGHDGRIGLHSLPRAQEFYRDIFGMTDMGIDTSYERLRYFEMTAAQASLHVQQPR